jgi:hypothetical protein
MPLKYSSSSALSVRPHIPDQILQRSSSSAVTDLRNECPSSGNPRVSSDSWVVSQRQSGSPVTGRPCIPDQSPSTYSNTHSSSYSGRSNVSDSVSQRQLEAPVTGHPYVLDQSSQIPIYAMNDPRFSSSTRSNVSDSRHISQRQSGSAMSYPSSSSGHLYAYNSSHVPQRPSSPSSLPDPRNEFTYSRRQYDSRNVSQRSSDTPVSNHPYYTPGSRNTSERPSNYFASNASWGSRIHQQPSTFAVTNPGNEYPAFDHSRNVNCDSRNSSRKPLNYFISY